MTEERILEFAHSDFYSDIKGLLDFRKANIQRSLLSNTLDEKTSAHLRGLYAGVDYLIFMCEKRLAHERELEVQKEKGKDKENRVAQFARKVSDAPPFL